MKGFGVKCKHFFKKKWVMLVPLLVIPLFLGGCGRDNAAQQATQKQVNQVQNAENGQNKKAANDVAVYQGNPIIYSNEICIPVIVENTGVNPIELDTAALSMKFKHVTTTEHKGFFKTKTSSKTTIYNVNSYNPSSHPSDFTMQLASGDQWQSFIVFQLSDAQYAKLTTHEIENGQLCYASPMNGTVKAAKIPHNVTAQELASKYSGFTPTDLGAYYQNVANIMKQAAQQAHAQASQQAAASSLNAQSQKSSQKSASQTSSSVKSSSVASSSSQVSHRSSSQSASSSSASSSSAASNITPGAVASSLFNDQYNDSDYGDLEFRIRRLDAHHVQFVINNNTQSNMTLNLNDIELVGKNNVQVTISPKLNNYQLFIPNQKTTYAIFTTSAALTGQNYKPGIKADTSDSNGDNQFFTTASLPHPITYDSGD